MSEEKNEKGFVFKDRRRFDSEGNERAVEAETVPAPAAKAAVVEKKEEKPQAKPQPEISKPKVEEKRAKLSDPGSEEINFGSFIMSLATQALMQLGEIKPPPGMQIEVDEAAARQTIDILGMLQEKTKSNLEAEEAHLLEQILHNLRLSYVKVVEAKSKKG